MQSFPRMPRSRRKAFVGAKTFDGRPMVVLDRSSKKWMLPGGHVRARESTKSGAIREFFEETGNRALAPMKRVHDKNGVSLYETRVVPGSKEQRVGRFKRRPDKRETADYGFLTKVNGEYVVTDFSGKKKHVNPKSFRKGTLSLASKLGTSRSRSSSGRSMSGKRRRKRPPPILYPDNPKCSKYKDQYGKRTFVRCTSCGTCIPSGMCEGRKRFAGGKWRGWFCMNCVRKYDAVWS